jgi:soluble lytic murein transglycosylase
LLIFGAVISSQSFAYSKGVYNLGLSNKDKKIVEVLKAIKGGNWNNAHKLANHVNDPLSNKLYLWLYFLKDKKPASYDQLSSFLYFNPDFPKHDKLLYKAEKLMPSDLPAKKIISWHSKYEPKSPAAMEKYIAALLASGKKDIARSELQSWWKKTLLTPDQQRHFLMSYPGLLNLEAHKKRFDTLLFKRHYTNAKALAKLIGKGYPQLAAARIALAEKRGGVDGLIEQVPPYLKKDPGLLYERLKWRRKHEKNFSAIEILHNPPPAKDISNLPEWWKERHILIRRMIEKKQYESAYLLADKHMQKDGLGYMQAQFIAGWLALNYMKEPWRAFEHFEALFYKAKTPISRARGAYWSGVASKALGHKEIANEWFRKAAQHQTVFYGQFALSALPSEFKPDAQLPPAVKIKDRKNFESWEMVRAVKLLHAAGMKKEAKWFLGVLAEKSRSPAEYKLAAELAEELKYSYSAIRISKAALKKNVYLTEQAYPTLLSYMKYSDLEWSLVHGVIRQESAFDVDAKSPAGARGLMQLMPATAREVARSLKISHRTSWLTSKASHNIRLGSTYMKKMLKRYDGYYPLAIAAYNAGPGRVDRWIKEIGDPREGEIKMIDWIETIPVYETRNYVQRVMEATYVYRLKFHDIQKKPAQPLHIALN